MSTFRNNDFTPKQIKLVDLTVKGVSRKFKFIKGWSFTPDYRDYKAHLYVTIFVDWNKVAEFLGAEPKKIWKDEINNSETIKSTLITTFFERNGEEIPFEEGYKITMEILNYIKELYADLPDDNKIFYETEHIGTYYSTPVRLTVSEFKTLKNNQ